MPKTQRPATSDLLRDQCPRQLSIHNVHVLATSRPPRPWYLHDVAGKKSPAESNGDITAFSCGSRSECKVQSAFLAQKMPQARRGRCMSQSLEVENRINYVAKGKVPEEGKDFPLIFL